MGPRPHFCLFRSREHRKEDLLAVLLDMSLQCFLPHASAVQGPDIIESTACTGHDNAEGQSTARAWERAIWQGIRG